MRPMMTADHARAISALARKHKAEAEEVMERHFLEMAALCGPDERVETLLEIARDSD